LFQTIHSAYTAIKDHKSRISYDLFTLPTADFEQLIDQALRSEAPCTLNPERINQLLRASIDETSLINALANAKK